MFIVCLIFYCMFYLLCATKISFFFSLAKTGGSYRLCLGVYIFSGPVFV